MKRKGVEPNQPEWRTREAGYGYPTLMERPSTAVALRERVPEQATSQATASEGLVTHSVTPINQIDQPSN